MRRVFYGWWVVGGSFLLLFCATGAQFYAFPVFFAAMLEDMEWTRAETALAMTMGSMVIAITGLLIGVLMRRIGLRPLMLGGTIIAGIGFLLLSTVTQLWQFYLYYGLVLAAGVAGIYEIPNLTAVESWFDRGKSMALGIATTGMGMGGVIVAPLAGWLIARYDWQTAFAVMAGVVMVVGIPVSAIIMRTPQERKPVPHSAPPETPGPRAVTLRQALRRKAFWLIAISAMLWYWGFTLGLTHQVAFAVDEGIPPLTAAGAVGLLSAFSIPGRLAFGRLGDIIDKRYVMMIAAGMQMMAFVLLLQAITLPVLYLYSGLIGFAIGGLTPILPGILSDHFGRRHFSAIYGASYVVLALGVMAGPFYGGWIHDSTGSYFVAFVTAAAITLAAVLLLYLTPRLGPAPAIADEQA